MTIYVYEDARWEETLKLVDETVSTDLREQFCHRQICCCPGDKILENAAGNFYINDKPTGAVVGQQPFGGASQWYK
jgi:1-pyrroline-5-carboxylate dehydrogenase